MYNTIRQKQADIIKKLAQKKGKVNKYFPLSSFYRLRLEAEFRTESD